MNVFELPVDTLYTSPKFKILETWRGGHLPTNKHFVKKNAKFCSWWPGATVEKPTEFGEFFDFGSWPPGAEF